MQNKLLPCPFCGSEAERNLDYSKQIKCSNKNCLMSDYFIMTEYSWNTRVNPELDRYKNILNVVTDKLGELESQYAKNGLQKIASEFSKIKSKITQALDDKKE